MKSKIIKTVVSLIAIAAIISALFYGYNAYFTKKPVTAATRYYSTTAKLMNLEVSVQGTGAAYAASTSNVSAANNGTLKNLSVKAGDKVTKGQKLFVSDSDSIRNNIISAKDNLTKQELTLSSDEASPNADENKITMDKLSVNEAKTQLNDAYDQYNKMTVTAPINGIVTVVNNTNGDSVQPGGVVLTIVDMNSIKIKVAVDELDISKIKVGQKAGLKFDAIADKTYEGAVESISPVGNSSNNVTTYDVVVNVKSPAGIMIGMNANVTITVQSKDNALVIPAEALVERNGHKYVRVESTADNSTQQNTANTQNQTSNGQTSRNFSAQGTTNSGRLVAIKTGLETENYIEVTSGISEGDKVLVQLPQTSSTTNSTNNRNNPGGFGGQMGGGFGSGMGSFQGGNSKSSRTQGN